MKYVMLFFISALCVSGVSAWGQSASFIGSWELTGRQCEDNGKLVPVEGSLQEMVFRSDGSFQHSYIEVPDPNEEEEFEEYLEGLKERRDNFNIRQFEETHEEACRQPGGVFDETGEIDECTPSAKRRLYEEWRSSREQELKRIEEKIAEAEEFRPGSKGICQMGLEGRYQAEGDQMTFWMDSFSATTACGPQPNPPSGRRSIRYYFDEEDTVHFVQPADSNSREYCGRSDWSEIMFRK